MTQTFLRSFPVDVRTDHNETVCAIGDIHGNYHLMKAMVEELGLKYPESRLVFLGDLISRGPDSASCLLYAWYLSFIDKGPFSRVDIILGNHEHMFFAPLVSMRFDFSYPFWPSLHKNGHWMGNYFFEDVPAIESLKQALVDSEFGHELGEDVCSDLLDKWLHYAFIPFNHGVPALLESPVFKKSGNVIFVHAGVNTQKNIMKKFAKYNILNHTTKDFQTSPMWIKRVFVNGLKTHPPTHRGKPLFIVHGHTIDKKRLPDGWMDIRPKKHRICIDTGAYDTGILTSAIFSKGKIEVLQLKL